MTTEQLISLLKTKLIGHPGIEHHILIDSTQNRAWNLAHAGIAEGAVVVAEEQNCGRGRYNRHWYSPKSQGLYFSTILRPAIPGQYLPFLSLAASIALHRVIKPLVQGAELTIRWPNDLLVCGKKVAGILLEVEFDNGSIPVVVLGIGINISQKQGEFPPYLRETATSLEWFSKSPIDKIHLLADILNQLDKIYGECQEGELSHLLKEWCLRSRFLGKHILVEQRDSRKIRGVVGGINTDGSIIVIQDNEKLVLTGGDVHILD